MDEESDRWKDLHLTTHTTKRQIPTPPAGFEPAIPASEGPQAYALDRSATGFNEVHFSSV